MNIGILPSANSTKPKRVAKPGISVCSRINQTKKPKKGYYSHKKRKRRQECCGHCDNCTTIGLRLARLGNIGFSKRTTVPGKPDAKSLGTDSMNTIHSTQSTLREASFREKKGPSLNKIQVKNHLQRSPHAVKFEDPSQEETERRVCIWSARET